MLLNSSLYLPPALVVHCQVQEVLGYIEAGSLLPPLVVLQALARNEHLKLSVAKGYIQRQLTNAGVRIEADRATIARYQSETAAMRAEVQELKTQVCMHVHVCRLGQCT